MRFAWRFAPVACSIAFAVGGSFALLTRSAAETGALVPPARGVPARATTPPWAGLPAPVRAAPAVRPATTMRPPVAQVQWRRSRAVGLPYAGRLVAGVQLPVQGRTFVTFDPVLRKSPNRAWRRFGTDRLLRVVLGVTSAYAVAHPNAPRVVIGDLSRTHGGSFGKRYGGLGHRSHQNGLDVDIYYPRRDGREIPPGRVRDIDRALAQDLVRRFVRAGSRYVFIGPATQLRGPRGVVMKLVHHDDHMHVRIPR